MKLLVPPPVVALIVAVALWFAARNFGAFGLDFPFRTIVAVIVVAISLSLDIISIGLFFKQKTTVSPLSPDRTEQLVTDGLYKLTRNPMYLGLAGILTGYGIWLGTWWFVPAVAIFIWYITTFQIKPEEEILRSKFGTEYDDYCKQVRRWL